MIDVSPSNVIFLFVPTRRILFSLSIENVPLSTFNPSLIIIFPFTLIFPKTLNRSVSTDFPNPTLLSTLIFRTTSKSSSALIFLDVIREPLAMIFPFNIIFELTSNEPSPLGSIVIFPFDEDIIFLELIFKFPPKVGFVSSLILDIEPEPPPKNKLPLPSVLRTWDAEPSVNGSRNDKSEVILVPAFNDTNLPFDVELLNILISPFSVLSPLISK